MLLILGGLGIFARWPFEELCSAEDDGTHPWRPWHLRQVAVRGALQRRGRLYCRMHTTCLARAGSRERAARGCRGRAVDRRLAEIDSTAPWRYGRFTHRAE